MDKTMVYINVTASRLTTITKTYTKELIVMKVS